MKKIPVFLFVWLLSFWLAATDAEKKFDQANQFYEDGEYAQALNHYLQLNESMSHWKLFYNMGNCYFKLGQYVEAKIFYLRAKKFKPFLPSIDKNISVVNKKFMDKIKLEKKDFIKKTIDRIESLIPVNFVSALLVFFVMFLNMFIFILFKKGKKKWLNYGVSIFLLLSLFTSVYHVYRVKKQTQNDTAVIIKKDSELRSGPGENNTVLFKINPGLEVKIIDQSRNWFQVSASSEIAGWIRVEDLEII